MIDQEILDNAPESATHWNECNYMRYNPNSGGWHFYDKTTSEWLYTYTNDLVNLAIAGDIRSLEDIRCIVKLEANQVRAETLINELHMQIFPSSYMDNRVCLYKAITEEV